MHQPLSKDRGKFHLRTGQEGSEGEWRSTFTPSLTSALDGWVVNATSRPLYLQERPSTLWIGAGWSTRLVWTGAENLAPNGIRSPDHPARSESLYRLRSSDPQTSWWWILIVQHPKLERKSEYVNNDDILFGSQTHKHRQLLAISDSASVKIKVEVSTFTTVLSCSDSSTSTGHQFA
jgi:hypothetical protein